MRNIIKTQVIELTTIMVKMNLAYGNMSLLKTISIISTTRTVKYDAQALKRESPSINHAANERMLVSKSAATALPGDVHRTQFAIQSAEG